jgi:hypothetical protein
MPDLTVQRPYLRPDPTTIPQTQQTRDLDTAGNASLSRHLTTVGKTACPRPVIAENAN